MNRAERRKAGVKDGGKTYIFNSKESIVKAAVSGVAREAMDAEIKRQILKMQEELELYTDASILWTLHVSCGFGKARLEKFYRDFIQMYQEMRKVYEDDDSYAELYKLKQMGVDVERLREEVERDGLL